MHAYPILGWHEPERTGSLVECATLFDERRATTVIVLQSKRHCVDLPSLMRSARNTRLIPTSPHEADARDAALVKLCSKPKRAFRNEIELDGVIVAFRGPDLYSSLGVHLSGLNLASPFNLDVNFSKLIPSRV
jgi:hypothetical protein